MSKLLDSPWFYAIAILLLIAAFIATQFRWEIAPKPVGGLAALDELAERNDVNVLFIVLDTLRSDHLSSYGYSRPTSPTLDGLAARGIRFANVESQSSWTKSSMASMLTGLYPESTGITRSQHTVPEEAVLPSEIFKAAGYRTAGVWRNGWVATNFGFDQGYDMYVKPVPSVLPDRLKRKPPGTHALQGTDHDLTESARSFVHSFRDERFFLYLHYMDIHQFTYDGASDLFGSTYIDAYDNAIHWVDGNLNKLFESMRNLGLLEKTVIFVVTDHGEAFAEHGNEGHAKDLYTEVQKVPWFVSLPFDLEEPIAIDTLVANIDVIPTMLDMLGLDPLPGAEGISQMPAIRAAIKGEPLPPGRPVFSQLDRWWGKPSKDPWPYVAMVDPPYRLHQREADRGITAELFDHRTDPREMTDLSTTERETTVRMLKAIKNFRDERDPVWGDPDEIELNTMMLNQLRALGYAVE